MTILQKEFWKEVLPVFQHMDGKTVFLPACLWYNGRVIVNSFWEGRRINLSLQLIAGNSGSGKSHYIYEKIIRESVEHPERNYLMIVPEQFTMQTEKELVSLHPRKGILNIDVLSFNRLAYRVFEERCV